jgi:solute carrier family 26 (sodium-independent sulfate anion transporter), member 11
LFLTCTQFHFATILSPWIRRALIAGGFGIGDSFYKIPHEIAPVVSYRDEMKDDRDSVPQADGDLEGSGLKKASSSAKAQTSTTLFAPETPFFHLDLTAAVHAAELSLAASFHKNSSS